MPVLSLLMDLVLSSESRVKTFFWISLKSLISLHMRSKLICFVRCAFNLFFYNALNLLPLSLFLLLHWTQMSYSANMIQ